MTQEDEVLGAAVNAVQKANDAIGAAREALSLIRDRADDTPL